MTTVTTTLVSGQNAYVGAISSRGEYSVSVSSGVQGPQGDTGVGITAANVISGNLIITFSNSSTVDAGTVVGATGATGATGANGAAANTGNLTFSNTTITAVTNADLVIRTIEVNPSASPAINATHSWTYSKTGTLTFPDATIQTTAFTGSFDQITTGIPRLPQYTSATNAIHAVDISPGGTASRPGAMYFDTGNNVVRAWSSNSSTWLTFATTTDLTSYQTTAGLSANVAALTANNTSFVGTVSAANVVSNSQLSANLANYQTTAGLSANVATLSANNTSFVGTVSAANVVSNSQLSSNLANYQTTAGLSANVATLTANNTSFVGTVSAANVVSNSQLQSNLANYALRSGATFTGNVTLNGSLTVAGNTTYVGSNNTVYSDNLIELHAPPGGISNTWTSNDGRDIGLRFHYYDTADNNAALLRSNNTGYLEWYATGAEDINGVFSGTLGIIKMAGLRFSDGTNQTTSVSNSTSNNTNFVGSVSAANVVSNSQLQSNLANYQTTAGLSANVLTLTANNTLFVGSVSAANVVSNSQLSANLANYQTTAGLSANVATLSANNASFLGTVAAASYVQNTDSRTLSGNLVFSGANASFTGNVAFTGSKITIPFGPSNSNTDVSLVALTLSLIT